VTDPLPPSRIRKDYERHTGEMIVKKIHQLKLAPTQCPFILVANHSPFAWGQDAVEAVENAIVLECLCKMAFLTHALTGKMKSISQALIEKHFFRKHGRQAYYGQEKGKGHSKNN
jgi:L-ribulose-5-phosphate 4-epimerase